MTTPPKFALKFLSWFCPQHLHESVEGDLMQQFEEDIALRGERQAKMQFILNVLSFFRPAILLRNRFSTELPDTIMIANYARVAVRNISKRKLYSFINAFGLSIAIAFCILIYLFIVDEMSFDRFHDNPQDIVAITEIGFNREMYEKGDKYPYHSSLYVPARLAEVLQNEVPEVMHITRFCSGEGVMQYNDRLFKQEVSYADSGFFGVFSFRILSGSVEKIFRGNEAVLTKEVAVKLFGSEDPIGKLFTFTAQERISFVVAAIIETPPANSSIDFQMILPIATRPFFKHNREQWGAFSYPTFARLHEKADTSTFRRNLAAITVKYMSGKFEQWRERGKIPSQYKVADFGFVSLPDLHLAKSLSWTRSSDPKYSVVLAGISILILVIACINYISLALTTSASRRIEVGIRKVVGAVKRQLVYQFGFESIILATISLIFGIVLVFLFLPAFNDFTAKGIELSGTSFVRILIAGLLIALVVGMLAGAYPSFFLSAYKPVVVLKGRFTSRLQAGFTRPLVIFQFALSAFLIISAIIMFRQMHFVTTKDLGYDQEQMIVVQTQGGWSEEADRMVERFRQEISNQPGITGVAGTSSSFNHGWSRYGYTISGENKTAYVYRVDPYYIPLLGLELKEGRGFDPRIASDTTAIVVNEALVRDMGWEQPLDEYLNWREDTVGQGSKVIGVLKDYHFLSLEQKIEPMFLSMDKKNVGYLTEMMIKIEPGDVPARISRLRKSWTALFPDKPFDYTFLDEDVSRQYDKYMRWMNIAGLATVFAIVIASLGLFGLAGVNAVNRTKEIGIRKVMGADLMNIFVLLNRQYIWMAFVAFAIATPFSWYFMNQWIGEFEFHITIGWEVFVTSMAAGLLIALLTVSYHGIKSTRVNPAELLRYE